MVSGRSREVDRNGGRAARFFPAALLSQTAGADAVVSPDGARALHATLGSHYVTAPERQRYVEYPGAAHMMDEPTRQRAWAESLSWLERFLR
jgi:acetyl esterase/lipase